MRRRSSRRRTSREQSSAPRRRRARHRVAHPQARAAYPGARDLRDPPVDHVRGAVRVRFRRRDPAAGRRQLPGVPDAGDLRPDARVCLDHDGDRVRRRHDEGDHRPVSLPPDGALRGPERQDVRGRPLHARDPRRADAERPRRGMARPFVTRRLPVRGAADGLLHLRDGVGRRLPRARRADGRDRAAARLPDHLPADLPLERLCAHCHASRRAPADRRVEPDQRADAGDPPAVREPEPVPVRLVSGRAPVPALDPVDRGDPRHVRPARHPPVPGDRPLTGTATIPPGVDFDLTSEQELIRDTVRSFARERVAPVAEELDRQARFPVELVREMAGLGLMGIPIDERYGGAGGDTVSYAIAIEELTRIDSSVAITVAAHTSLGTMPILLFGNEEQKQEWLPRLASGQGLAAFGLTEPDAGSDAGATRTKAELRDGEWVIDGSKIFITNAGTDISACVTITARTGKDEISNLIVPNGTAGYEISAPMHKLGWHASDTRELSFRSCAVPEGNLLGERGRGFVQFMEILDGGRISVAAMGVGLAQGAYDLAAAYAKERHQFGEPIASFQAIQFQLADMATEIEAGRQLVYRAAWLKDEGKPFALAAAQAKLFTGILSNRVVNSALQIHGGYGFMDEFAISRLYRDQKILEIGEGTNEVQRMVIAKQLGL